jgi:hypothetical protein
MAKQNSTQRLNEELGFLRDQITSIGAQIGEAINERLEETGNIVDRVSSTINKTTAKAAVKSVTDLTKGLDSALQNQLKINQGALKLSDITKAQQGLESRRLTLKQNLQNLENLGLITAKERAKQEQELSEEMYEVTIRVKVPDKNDTIYITGNQSILGDWQPGKVKMRKVSEYEREIMLKLKSPAKFKFTRGNWDSEAEVIGTYNNITIIPEFRQTFEFEINNYLDRFESNMH